MTVKAYVLMSVTPPTAIDGLMEKLKKIKGVKEAHPVYGIYDVIVGIEADDMNEVKDIIAGKIRKLDGVHSTMTLIVVE